MKPPQKLVLQFQQTIEKYYRTHRRDLPWRRTRDSYAILVSEVMLQQTQAERVIPKYIEWMQKFPTAESLAKASVAEVLKSWQGLGYNRRALNLKRAAEMIVSEYGGVVPKDVSKIDALPGVGPYTAGAIAAFAFDIPSAFIETNIRTVYLHFFFKGKREVGDEEILEMVEQTLPNHPTSILRHPFVSQTRHFPSKEGQMGRRQTNVRGWYNALMDYGAMLKATVGNPNTRSKHYAKQSKFKGSRRELRGKILRKASLQGEVVPTDFKKDTSDWSPIEIISELVQEGFLKKEGKGFRLA